MESPVQDVNQNVKDIPQATEELRALAQEAAAESSDDRKFMEPKKKTGRKRKNPDDPKWQKIDAERAQKEEPQSSKSPDDILLPSGASAFSKNACRGSFKLLGAVIVRTTGLPDTAPTDSELEDLSEMWGRVVDQYAPQVVAKYGNLIGAGTVTFAYLVRVKGSIDLEIERRLAEKERQEAAEAAAAKQAGASRETSPPDELTKL